MANLIDYGLIHSSLALLLSRSPSHSVCMGVCLCQSEGIAVHVAITLLRLFFHLMTEHVFSPVYNLVSACEHERMSSDLSKPIVGNKKKNNNNNKIRKKRTNLFGIYSLVSGEFFSHAEYTWAFPIY